MSVNNTQSFDPSYDTCKAVSVQCPVSETLYGGYFSSGASIFFAVAFGLMLLLQMIFLFKSRAWSYGIWLGIGTLGELMGYLFRKLLSDNPWRFIPMVLQLFLLMLAPTFVAAAMSITFKHLIIYYGRQWSIVKPWLYPWILVGSDVVSIFIQAIGCVFTAMASADDKPDPSKSDIGSALLIVGVAFQLVNMIICGGLMIFYYYRRSKSIKLHGNGGADSVSSGHLDSQMTFLGYDRVQIFMWSISIGFVAIIIRCIYRIPEMASGWGSKLMKDEVSFLICDGTMVLIAVILVSVFHPAVFFPQMTGKGKQHEKDGTDIPLRDNAV